MERIFLAVIFSALLLLAACTSLFVFPDHQTTLLRPFPERLKPVAMQVADRQSPASAGDRR